MLWSIAQSIPFVLGLGRFTLHVEARFGDDTVMANPGQQAAMAAE